uniref:hypothetical protein n=1 Tax=Ornithobacterium rhinotracheale TaxID=28251 RepID=UPI0039A701DC
MEPIFKENPQLDVVYKTSDGKYFYTENNAKNYAQTLEDKKVVKLERGEDKSEKVIEAVSKVLQNVVVGVEKKEEALVEETEESEKIAETATEDVAKPNKKQTKTKK